MKKRIIGILLIACMLAYLLSVYCQPLNPICFLQVGRFFIY